MCVLNLEHSAVTTSYDRSYFTCSPITWLVAPVTGTAGLNPQTSSLNEPSYEAKYLQNKYFLTRILKSVYRVRVADNVAECFLR